MNSHRRVTLNILGITAVILYILADTLINPFIFWTCLPLYISYYFVNKAARDESVKKLFAAYGFMAVSIIFSIFYHITWYIDWQETRTGSSTSALIFVWLPIYSVILGFMGYALGHLTGILLKKT
jgi:hypothetical protein